MNEVVIKKGQLGQNVLNTEDSISGILFSTANKPMPSGMDKGKTYIVYTLSQVKSLGITAKYDSDQKMFLYRDIVEFFRMAGEGTKLYLLGGLGTIPELIETHMETFLNKSKGEMRQCAIIGSEENNQGNTINGIPTEVYQSIPLLQEKANIAFEAGRPLQFVLSSLNIKDYNTLEHFRDDDTDIYENISICIGTDLTNNSVTQMPLVGTLLGTIAKASVNENVGKVEKYRIDNPLIGLNTNPAIGNIAETSNIPPADLKLLKQKGYIFPIEIDDYVGVYWNDDPTLAKEIKDAEGNMNPCSIQKGRTLNKAVRLVRRAMIPQLRKNYKMDANTGLLPTATIKLLEGKCESAIDIMGDEISGREVKLDPNSNLFTGDKALVIKSIKVVPEGIVGAVVGNINLNTNI